MRQSQKNNNRPRSRGRKPSNPLTRSFDSNGPDVKIRGTASHISEKYQSLARDALASGDIVMAENYYQHAEHYLRIIAAAQTSSREEGRQPAGNGNGNNEQGSQDRSNNNNRRNNQNSAPQDITGDEPQPDVDFSNTAVEMEVAVIKPYGDDKPQPDVEAKATNDSDAKETKEPKATKDSDDEEAPTPRRRRRTTYRSRKRTTGGDGNEDAGGKSEGGEADVAKVAAED
ncbi:protein of unknown function [Cohaesibacter sp. ES.047]|uniref:DUF4167 domain-containing protein n=1 Tax=Cohaesibacter sp. ES.047 TaxID=1798205 RepID=UPI000BB680B8|nr:DUF4167 domain-containing protein [Cohaesibacter sp. ES.047]SNY92411.1 protein of unknown function [Cohaesibacter sp. ES.047]